MKAQPEEVDAYAWVPLDLLKRPEVPIPRSQLVAAVEGSDSEAEAPPPPPPTEEDTKPKVYIDGFIVDRATGE